MPATTTTPSQRPRSAATCGQERADHVDGRPERGQLAGRYARPAEERAVIVERFGSAVVGQPGAGHRRRARSRGTGEAHGEVVDRLEVPAGGARDVGHPVLEVEDVTDRVRARGRRGATAPADERGRCDRGVSGDVPTDRRAGEGPSAGVGPEQAGSDRPTPVVDRHRARPLAGAGDGHDRVGRDRTGAERPPRCTEHERPPLVRILGGPPVGADLRRHRLVLAIGDPPGERDEPHLRAPGPEIDGEDVGVLAGPSRSPPAGVDRGAVRHPTGSTAARPSCRPSPSG